MDEDKFEKYASVFKEITENAISRDAAMNLCSLFERRNYCEMISILSIHNKGSRKIFEMETGIRLPKTQGKTRRFIQEYCRESFNEYINEVVKQNVIKCKAKAIEKEQKRQNLLKELDGFGSESNTSNMILSRMVKFLTDTFFTNEFNQGESYRDAIRRWAKEDVLSTHEGHNGNRITYWTVREEENYHDWGKFAYDYAEYLIENKKLN